MNCQSAIAVYTPKRKGTSKNVGEAVSARRKQAKTRSLVV